MKVDSWWRYCHRNNSPVIFLCPNENLYLNMLWLMTITSFVSMTTQISVSFPIPLPLLSLLHSIFMCSQGIHLWPSFHHTCSTTYICIPAINKYLPFPLFWKILQLCNQVPARNLHLHFLKALEIKTIISKIKLILSSLFPFLLSKFAFLLYFSSYFLTLLSAKEWLVSSQNSQVEAIAPKWWYL